MQASHHCLPIQNYFTRGDLMHQSMNWHCLKLTKVDTFLAQYQLQRKVGKNGQITIGGEHEYYSVGSAYAGQFVQIPL